MYYNYFEPKCQITENLVLGLHSIEKEDFQEAIRIFSLEPKSSPYYGIATAYLGLALFRIEDYKNAELSLNQAFEYSTIENFFPPSGLVFFKRILGEVVSHQNKYTEALQIFNTVVHLCNHLQQQNPTSYRELELEKAHTFNSWAAIKLRMSDFDTAIKIFHKALEIYRVFEWKCPGFVETLTNYGLALWQKERKIDAELALKEAKDIAEQENFIEQIHRINIALIQLGSQIIPQEKIYDVILTAAQDAKNKNCYATAYLRYCILIKLALENKDIKTGLAIVSQSLQIEKYIDDNDINPAQMRVCYAQLLELNGESAEKIIEVLIEGAYLWFTKLHKTSLQDFGQIATLLHEHFRLLSRKLLDIKLYEQALLSFEAGRSLAYAIEIDFSFLQDVIEKNPFAKKDFVDCDLLKQNQLLLKEGEVFIIPCIIPPDLVAFVVKHKKVDVINIPLPAKNYDCEQLVQDIKAIPIRLNENVGKRAIPSLIWELATKIKDAVKNNTIVRFIPYNILHSVPWRTLMYDTGISWKKLQFPIEFGLFIRNKKTNFFMPNQCIALGNGMAKDVDLCEEAKKFASFFAKNGEFISNCKSQDVRNALSQNSIVLISCHGIIRERLKHGDISLELRDGIFLVEEILPETVQAPIVILSACDSGVYNLAWGDYPIGAAPTLIKLGVHFCIATRFAINANFSVKFMEKFGELLSKQEFVITAFVQAMESTEGEWNLWKDLSCLEILGNS